MKAEKQNSFLQLGLIALVIVSLGLMVGWWIGFGSGPQVADTPQSKTYRSLAVGPMANFLIKPDRPPVPDYEFQDGQGQRLTLKQWQGRVVLLNLWATWCGPCREEMPTLNALQKQLGSKDFEVVAVSLDRKGTEVSAPFLQKNGAQALAVYADPTAKGTDLFQLPGLPFTLLIDRHGREIGRFLGPTNWNSPEAQALIKQALTEP